MIRIVHAALSRKRDERGAEAAAMIIVLPMLIVLVFAILDIGMMLRTRMAVENVVRDAARHVAADGGNYNPRTHPANTPNWDVVATNTLWANGQCTQGFCKSKPVVDCTKVTTPSGVTYRANAVNSAGDIITCSVHYDYKPINGALLNSPLGLGLGSLLKPFGVTASARAETGVNG